MPVGAAKTVATLSPTEPAVVEWDWTTPPDAADHTCLLVVVDSPSNPIPAPSKVFDVGQLVTHEKHIGLKNLHVVSVPPGMMHWTPFRFFGTADAIYNVKIISSAAGAWKVGLLLPKAAPKGIKFQGTARRKLNQQELGALLQRLENRRNDFDTTNLYVVSDLKKGGVLTDLKLARGELEVMLLLVAPSRGTSSGTLTILQERGQTVVGGSTFVLSTTKKRS